MKHIGYVEIKDNEVIFVYHELDKPPADKEMTKDMYNITFHSYDYMIALNKYKASKRSVEVSNAAICILEGFNDCANVYMKDKNSSFPIKSNIENGQACEAEIKNGIATIVKIL